MNGRDKRRRRAERAKQRVFCSNCGEQGRHFVPASMGEPGFFTCGSSYHGYLDLKFDLQDLLPHPFAHRRPEPRLQDAWLRKNIPSLARDSEPNELDQLFNRPKE